MSTLSLFVTGTDTGVGKTLVAAALVAAFAGKGLKAAGMKPVASGAQGGEKGLRNDDALALMAQSNVEVPYERMNPYCFEPAIAPHIAAAEAGVRIEVGTLVEAHARLAQDADVIVIEGAGGWFTPLNDSATLATFAASIGAPVILVVGLRLGCINHALLTAEAVRHAGLELAGWIANTLDPQMPRRAQNIATLNERLAAPLLAEVPHDPDLTPAQVSGLFEGFVSPSR